MADEPKPWRAAPFERSKKYIVRRAFRSRRDSFRSNEVLTYDTDHYSRHDSCTAYVFYDSNNKQRVWDVDDNEDLGAWRNYFSMLEIAEGP